MDVSSQSQTGSNPALAMKCPVCRFFACDGDDGLCSHCRLKADLARMGQQVEAHYNVTWAMALGLFALAAVPLLFGLPGWTGMDALAAVP